MFPAASPEASPAPAVRSNTDAIAGWVIVAAYAAAQIALFIGHDTWRDEGQAWLWARALASPPEFFVIPGEGHPPLWFWLLRALSTVLSFDQARYLTLGTAILNAILLRRLLRGEILLLTLLLGTLSVTQYWGFHFRPYSLIFTSIIGALLLERGGRNIAATWLLALACGFHFFAGLIFGFWILVQLQRRTPIRQLLAPAILAALFGLSAILSGLGNPEGEPTTSNFLAIVIYNLAWATPWPGLRQLPIALVTIALLCYGLWGQKLMLGFALALMLAFSIGSAVFYGQSPWHSAFLLMLAFVAFRLAGSTARQWTLMALLVPHTIAGLSVGLERLLSPSWTHPDIYATVAADAGPGFDPTKQLVSWQDFMLTATAATHDISYLSGNNGELLGPVDWRRRIQGRIDPILGTTPVPYWLVCSKCEPALAAIAAAGLSATELTSFDTFDDGPFAAYRINR